MERASYAPSGRTFVITVGVDFTERCEHAIALACSIAHGHADVVVHAVHVAPLPMLGEPTTHVDLARELTRLQDVCAPVVGDIAASVRCHVIPGRPDDALVRFAHDCDADILIIGGKERSAIGRLVTGSVSTKIVRSAPCSVLVARPHEHEPAVAAS